MGVVAPGEKKVILSKFRLRVLFYSDAAVGTFLPNFSKQLSLHGVGP